MFALVKNTVTAEAAFALGVAAAELRWDGKVALLTSVDLAVTALATSAGL